MKFNRDLQEALIAEMGKEKILKDCAGAFLATFISINALNFEEDKGTMIEMLSDLYERLARLRIIYGVSVNDIQKRIDINQQGEKEWLESHVKTQVS